MGYDQYTVDVLGLTENLNLQNAQNAYEIKRCSI